MSFVVISTAHAHAAGLTLAEAVAMHRARFPLDEVVPLKRYIEPEDPAIKERELAEIAAGQGLVANGMYDEPPATDADGTVGHRPTIASVDDLGVSLGNVEEQAKQIGRTVAVSPDGSVELVGVLGAATFSSLAAASAAIRAEQIARRAMQAA